MISKSRMKFKWFIIFRINLNSVEKSDLENCVDIFNGREASDLNVFSHPQVPCAWLIWWTKKSAAGLSLHKFRGVFLRPPVCNLDKSLQCVALGYLPGLEQLEPIYHLKPSWLSLSAKNMLGFSHLEIIIAPIIRALIRILLHQMASIKLQQKKPWHVH